MMGLESREERVPWTLRQALVLILFINLFQLAISLVGKNYLDKVMDFNLLSLLDALLYIGGVYAFVRFKAKGGWVDLGLHTRKLLRSILAGTFTGFVTAITVLLAGYLMVRLIGEEPSAQQVQEVARQAQGLWQISLFLVIASLIVPIKEELVFRGFIYPAFRDRVGVTWGIILTAVFFSLVHGDLIRFIPLLIGGIALNIVYQRTGSLYSSIVAHGVWNGIMGVLAFWR
ncbi:MAG TPA: type II CAAX endopeptidase family protein [Candidatus Deferrimicrobium sp.]|nr:type II CAAX endopeptidase family protein [Candidatus Deferrimicrobium sp.]